MSVVVFAGPTMTADAVRARLDAAVRPPAARGDVLRAVDDGVKAIGLIDGVFERVAAVWHKEILWALSRGVRVYGAASMGALRAAELAAFGMVPVGDIAARYLRGELDDDDEVAVAHRDAEGAWAPVSEAMVNLRATLQAARDAAVLSSASCDALVALAKSHFYAERSFVLLDTRGERAGVPRAELDALRAWWTDGRVDLKRRDAEAMLDKMRDERGTANAPALWQFAHTDAWESLRRSVVDRGA